MLARNISRTIGQRPHRLHAPHQRNRRALGLHHFRQHCPANIKGGTQVHQQRLLPDFIARAHRCAIRLDARAVRQNMQRSQICRCRSHLGRSRQIDRPVRNVQALQRRLAVPNQHLGPPLTQQFGRSQSNTARPTRNECRFSVEVHVWLYDYLRFLRRFVDEFPSFAPLLFRRRHRRCCPTSDGRQ